MQYRDTPATFSAMTVVLDELQELLEKIDAKLIDLLTERANLCTRMKEDTNIGESINDTVAYWMEEIAERGLDEEAAEKLCRAVIALCKETPED